MSTKGAVTPFEILSTHKRLQNELRGLERFKYPDSCVASKDPIFLLMKCIDIKKRKLDILRRMIY